MHGFQYKVCRNNHFYINISDNRNFRDKINLLFILSLKLLLFEILIKVIILAYFIPETVHININLDSI